MRLQVLSPLQTAYVLVTLALAGCVGSGGNGDVYEMGNPANAGALSFVVLDAEWRESLEGPNAARLPANRFLLVTATVRNQGSVELPIPLLKLIGMGGNEFREEQNGDGVPQWFGLFRSVKPGETLSGKFLFDVQPGGYKLRIASGDAENEAFAFITLPFRAVPPPVKGVDPTAAHQPQFK